MIVRTYRIDGNQRYSWIKKKRSWFVSRTRFTYNFTNTATQYQSGVDMHFDWALPNS